MEFPKTDVLNTVEALDELPKDTIIVDFFNDGEFAGQLCTLAQKIGADKWSTIGASELFTAEQLLAGGDNNFVVLRHGEDALSLYL